MEEDLFTEQPGGCGCVAGTEETRKHRSPLALRPPNQIAVDSPGLQDRVADNLAKFDITESEELLIGRNFGVGTDIQTGPNGNLYVVSLSNGAVYEVFRRRPGGNSPQ